MSVWVSIRRTFEMAKAQKITDQDFINLYKEIGSPAKIAKMTGISERRILARRRVIENKYSISLPSKTTKNPHEKHFNTVHDSPTSINLGMLNGKVLVFSDAHFLPAVRTTAFKALLWMIGETKPDVIVANGDIFDGSTVSRHPAGGWEKLPTVLEELHASQACLEEISEAAKEANPNVKLIFTLGNHDARFGARLATMAPEYAGVYGFDLESHFPDWQHCISCFLNDEIVVMHRWKGGQFAVAGNARMSGISYVTGHLHALQCIPITDFKGTRWGVDTGTLAQPFAQSFNYAMDTPRNWRSGFVSLSLLDGQLLVPELIMVNDANSDCVEWRGQVWDVSEF